MVRWGAWLVCNALALALVAAGEASDDGCKGLAQPDCAAWQALFDSTKGPGWLACSQLRSDPCACSFHQSASTQVHCEGGHVTGLYLGSNNLQGTLPSLDLPYLKTLSVGNNSIVGTVPRLHMPLVEFLSLERNQLTGTLPRLEGFPQLRTLELQFNRFEGTVPQVRLQSLVSFDATGNRLTGTVPPCEDHVSLQRFAVAKNQLTGTLPTVRNCTSFLTLSVFSNRLEGTIPLALINTATDLFLSDNRLEGTLPDVCPSTLDELDVAGNRLTGTIPVFGDCLVTLYRVARNRLHGTIPPVTHLFTLEYLDVSENSLTGSIPVIPTSLVHLIAFNNRLSGTIPPLIHASILEVVMLQNNFLQGTVPKLPESLLGNQAPLVRSALLLFNNYLSCPLPEQDKRFDGTYTALVALGNTFTEDAPDWVSPQERNAVSLFAPSLDSFLETCALLVVVGVAWFVASLLLVGGRDGARHFVGFWTQHARSALGKPRASLGILTRVPPCMRLLQHCTWGMWMVAVACVALVSVVTLCFEPLYACGEPLMHASLPYLGTDVRWQWAAAVTTSLLSVLATAVVLRLAVGSRAFFPTRSSLPVVSRALLRFTPRNVGATCAWLASLAVLSAPTAAEITLQSMPANNTLRIGRTGAAAVHLAIAPTLVFVSNVLLPRLSRWVARTKLGGLPGTAFLEQRVQHRHTMVSLVVFNVLIPLAVAVAISDGCFQGWKELWSLCHSPSRAEAGWFEIDVFEHEGDVYLSVDQVCAEGLTWGRCSRRAIQVASQLMVQKLTFQALFMPAMVLWTHFCCAPPQHQQHQHQHQHERCFPAAGRAHRLKAACIQAVAGFAQTASDVSVRGLSWVGLGIAYATTVPVVAVLAALSLTTHWLALRWCHAYRPRPLGTCARPPLLGLVLALVVMDALLVWFFFENALAGRELVAAVVATKLVGCGAWWWWLLRASEADALLSFALDDADSPLPGTLEQELLQQTPQSLVVPS